MSNTPNTSAYNQGRPAGPYALMTPPPPQEKKALPPLAYTAGGGLVVGVIAGLLLISGGGQTKAVAANAEDVKLAGAIDESAALDAPKTDIAQVDIAEVADPEAEAEVTAPTEDNALTVPDEPETVEANLRFEVHPRDIADIEITLDGEVIEDMSRLVSLDAGERYKTLQIVASADGYRDFKKKVKVSGDMSIPIEMRKVPKVADSNNMSSGETRTLPKEKRNKKSSGKKSSGKKEGPGGLLDL